MTPFQQRTVRQLARKCAAAVHKGAEAAFAGDADACHRHADDAADTLRSAWRHGLFEATREELRRMSAAPVVAAE